MKGGNFDYRYCSTIGSVWGGWNDGGFMGLGAVYVQASNKTN